MLILIECVRSLKRIDWIEKVSRVFVILIFYPPEVEFEHSLLSTKKRRHNHHANARRVSSGRRQRNVLAPTAASCSFRTR